MTDDTRKEIERLINDHYHGRTAKRFEPIGGDAIRGRASSVDRQGYLAARRQLDEEVEAHRQTLAQLDATRREVVALREERKAALTALAKSRAHVRLLDQEKADALAQADAMDAHCGQLGEVIDALEAELAALKAGRDAA